MEPWGKFDKRCVVIIATKIILHWFENDHAWNMCDIQQER